MSRRWRERVAAGFAGLAFLVLTIAAWEVLEALLAGPP